MSILIELLIVGFFINLLYEMLHSVLYKTCLKAPLNKYIYLMLKASLFDGLSISLIYLASYMFFKNISPFENYMQISLIILISIIFAYMWELHAVNNKRWEYTNKMPIILGVGLTPLVQLAITGILAIYWVF